MADLVPLAERGVYQGFIVLVWALAAGVGPVIVGGRGAVHRTVSLMRPIIRAQFWLRKLHGDGCFVSDFLMALLSMSPLTCDYRPELAPDGHCFRPRFDLPPRALSTRIRPGKTGSGRLDVSTTRPLYLRSG